MLYAASKSIVIISELYLTSNAKADLSAAEAWSTASSGHWSSAHCNTPPEHVCWRGMNSSLIPRSYGSATRIRVTENKGGYRNEVKAHGDNLKKHSIAVLSENWISSREASLLCTRGRAAFSFFLRKALQLLKKYSHLRKGLNITQDADE